MSLLTKNTKSFKVIVYKHSQSLRFFANVSLFFSNSYYRCIVVRYVAILLSSVQCIEGFLMTLKNFDYWCSVVLKQPITSKT